jgi:two-component system alkaline phosphatase synthesis response regulator PhoP
MPNEKILIVDDEEDIRELLRYNLSMEGYDIVSADSGEKAIEKAVELIPDLIVLDLMLPGIGGLEVAKELKNKSDTKNIPIIMLTARGEEVDIVTGLELGADDYITKPFSPRILTARIKAVLRRQARHQEHEEDVINIYGLMIHTGRREVTAGGRSFDLTFTEFQVLYHLAKRPGWVSTRSQIVDAVRGDGYPVTDRSVDVQVVGLRKKLGDFGKYIETVRGVGYKFREKL